MPAWRRKPANRQHLNKRLAPREYQARYNAACAAVQRLYCDVLGFLADVRLQALPAGEALLRPPG